VQGKRPAKTAVNKILKHSNSYIMRWEDISK